MTAGTPQAPALLPVIAEQIPAELREQPRWACWRAEWNPKRGLAGKWDKIPCHPRGYRVSTKRPEAWVSFDAALAAYQGGQFAGIGYLMTGEHGLVGVDLDSCVDAGRVAPWAQEVLDGLHSYAEVSPSGRGLRAFTRGTVEWDWNNHEQGIEVYAGHTPRFLTVTGQALGGSTIAAAPAGVLQQLGQRYAREREQATVISLAMPDLVDELALPDLAGLEIPPRTRDLLADGTAGADRSRSLFVAAVDLFRAGLSEAEVLSVLASNGHTMGIALDHRRQDHERALMYLWVEHTQKGKARAAASRVATADDFEDVAPVAAPSAPGAVQPRARFLPVQAGAFSRGKPMEWLIRGVLPQAELGAIYGEPGAGKSFFALDLVLAIARGIEWRGRRVKQGRVVYIVAEGAAGFRQRLRAASEFHGFDLDAVDIWIIGDSPNLLETGDIKDLVAGLRTVPGVVLVVVDTLAQTTPGADENSGKDMGRAIAHCKAISQALAVLVLLVAHSGKDASRGVRGWSGIKGALDVEIVVERSDEHRAATVTKMKDGTGEGDEFGFSLQSVSLGQDEYGDEQSSMVAVEAAGGRPSRTLPKGPRGAVQQLVLRIAQQLTDLAGELQVMALIDAVVNELPPAEAHKKDNRRRDVMRALESLAASGVLSVAGGHVSLQSSTR